MDTTYINKDKLLQDIDERGADFWCSSVDICNAKKLVSEQPAVDAQIVIRCGRCKYSKWDGFDNICTYHDKKPLKIDVDDYCSHAEQCDVL